jgi:low affinity Fe/Cu permease
MSTSAQRAGTARQNPKRAAKPANGAKGTAAAAAPSSSKRSGTKAAMSNEHKPNEHKSNGHKSSWFTTFAQKTAQLAGRPGAFILATTVIIVWGVSGPIFGYSDTWQLVINTGTTIVTFLMVFLIQHTQNRDSTAFQVKLDELIIAMEGAHNKLAGAEDLCDEDLEALHETYRKRAAHALDTLEERRAERKAS